MAERISHSKEEKIADIDKKIETHKANIIALEEKKEAILNPQPRKRPASIKSIIDLAKSNGMTPEEIAKKLGMKLD